MKLTTIIAALTLLTSCVYAAKTPDEPKKGDDDDILAPCTTRSQTSGSFFDLNPINLLPPDPEKKEDRQESWHARGHDYGANFTVNFCGPVIEQLDDVEGLEKYRYKNVSAFYVKDKKTYSIGQQNGDLVLRGRKLVLNYTHGSLCESGREGRRKSTIISLLCEKDPTKPKAAVAFIGASPDECAYFFEARSASACATINVKKQQLSPSGVFGVIAGIAVLVYIVGGIVYQRSVMHQRGWRQLPNYSIWAGMASFVRDMFIITFSSCTRCFLSKKGFNQITVNGTPNGRPRGAADDENRLIDQLDEEWDD